MTFEEWILTDEGKKVNDISTLTNQPYLKNRLWWAFDAGTQSNQQAIYLKNAMESLQLELTAAKIRNKNLQRQINKISKLTANQQPPNSTRNSENL